MQVLRTTGGLGDRIGCRIYLYVDGKLVVMGILIVLHWTVLRLVIVYRQCCTRDFARAA
jgi:hypothetical protein